MKGKGENSKEDERRKEEEPGKRGSLLGAVRNLLWS